MPRGYFGSKAEGRLTEQCPFHVFNFSLPGVELPPAKWSIVVSYETARRWREKFGQSFVRSLRHRPP
jgi:transposase-like protein